MDTKKRTSRAEIHQALHAVMGVVDFRLEWFIFHRKNFYIIENLISHAFQCQIIGLMENKLVVILSEQARVAQLDNEL